MTKFFNKDDIKSGFSVFLLALPLCLGIAIASNFPPIAGIITAIVGGIVTSFFGSSRLTIKGPAAGLIVIALGAVTELGGGDVVLGYKRALAVGVIAALIQILFSKLKLAKFAEVMPPSVIHGMLAAIGVIIIAKQSHVIFGVKPESSKPLALLMELPKSAAHFNPEIFLIGILSFIIILLWPKLKKLNFIPASIVVLGLSIPLSYYFDIEHPHLYSFMGHEFNLGPEFLINLPGQILNAITFPDFGVITSMTSIKYIIMFALVGSIESLLTVCAVDSLDPEKKKSDLNKDLMATGIGNLISSLIGGLPMISEIVRTKANIDYGAKSEKSNFFHGAFLLLSVVFLPWLLREIPLSALAALLVFTGLRLASPKEFSNTFKIGVDQFVLFTSTLVITLMTDLLVGVTVGIVLKVFFHFLRGARLSDFFKLTYTKEVSNDTVTLKITGALVFTIFLELKQIIQYEISKNKKVIIDISKIVFIDHTIQEKVHVFEDEGVLKIVGANNLVANGNHHLSFKSNKISME